MTDKKPLWSLNLKVKSYINPPKGNLKINITVKNLSDNAIYFSKIEVFPSWTKGKKGIKTLDMKTYLATGSAAYLTELNLQLPSIVGLYTLRFGLETWVYNYYTAVWENLGLLQTPDWGYIQVTPQQIYSVFVSCSSKKEDSPVINQILNMLKLWGFKPLVVGINRFSADPLKIPATIKRQIDSSDAVIGIATPRDYSIQNKVFKTFPWLHLETGMAFRSDKPLFFIIDERVKPEGLLEYPNFPKVFYYPTKLAVLEHRLAVVMPGFREWIAKRKQNRFMDGLVKAGLIMGGIWLVGELLAKEK